MLNKAQLLNDKV